MIWDLITGLLPNDLAEHEPSISLKCRENIL